MCNINLFVLQELGEFTWRVSDWWTIGLCILAEMRLTTLCIDGRGQCAPPYLSLLKFRQRLHLNQAGV